MSFNDKNTSAKSQAIDDPGNATTVEYLRDKLAKVLSVGSANASSNATTARESVIPLLFLLVVDSVACALAACVLSE